MINIDAQTARSMLLSDEDQLQKARDIIEKQIRDRAPRSQTARVHVRISNLHRGILLEELRNQNFKAYVEVDEESEGPDSLGRELYEFTIYWAEKKE
jgi:hypothetical protein